MIIRADARRLPLRDGCVDCIVTSPPYLGLRDYGDPQQIGIESTPDAYVAAIVSVFREVRRVLRDDGTVWLNLGDSYATAGGYGGDSCPSNADSKSRSNRGARHNGRREQLFGYKHKDLCGIPWRVAFALQADGWYLRSDIIWAKPNPMPESVTDRPTKAHEYLFLLTKSERYHYDAAAIRDPFADARQGCDGSPRARERNRGGRTDGFTKPNGIDPSGNGGRNKRTVWTIPTMSYTGAHFATMPEALVEPCILAGCPLGGLVGDPFLGSGTVGAVAERTGRRWVGTDLSYQALASTRTAQRGLFVPQLVNQ